MTTQSEEPPAIVSVKAIVEHGEYWEWRALVRDVEAAQIEAQRFVLQAAARRDAAYARLVEKYGLPAQPTSARWNDETREIVVGGQA